MSVFRLPQLLAAWVTGISGAFGLLLGTVGVYGVTAYLARSRFHEIGVRVALGADEREVRRMMVRRGMAAPLAGLLTGLVLAAGTSRLLQSFLVGVSPWIHLPSSSSRSCWVPLRCWRRSRPRAALRVSIPWRC